MQLKLRRSQRDSGVVSKTIVFCLDARAEFTAQEKQSIVRYKLSKEVLYNSEAANRHIAKADAAADGSVRGSLRQLASLAMAAIKLRVTVGSLEQGQHIECKTMDELLSAESAIMTACENMKAYLDAALTFDGREVVITFEGGGAAVTAQATAPAPMLASPSSARTSAAPETPALSYEPYEEDGDGSVAYSAGRAAREALDPGSALFKKLMIILGVIIVIIAALSAYLIFNQQPSDM